MVTFESYLFQPFDILSSWQPEFVRLVVNSVAVQETVDRWQYTANEWRYIYGYEYSYQLSWEIWGTGVPSEIQPVPEPSTMILLGSGLIGLLGLRRKFKK